MVLSPSPPPLLLIAAALTASTLVLHVHSLQLKPSPPSHPPKSLSSRSSSGPATTPRPAAAWNRGRSGGQSWRRSSTTPLRAYTVADNSKSWKSFWEFPTFFDDLASQFGFGAEDSLYSFEGGGAAKAASRPSMPNLEMETAAIMATEGKSLEVTMEKDELLSELNTLTKTFDDLQSSMDYKSQLHSETITGYESKIENLDEKNALLEKGLNLLTATLERQKHHMIDLQQEKNDNTAKEGERADRDVGLLLQVRDDIKTLEEDNGMLRQRLRFLEVELSDIAFESRKGAMPATATAVAKQTAAQNFNGEGSASIDNVEFTPKAPRAPVPPHIFQQRHLEQLQLQVDDFKRERLSVRKLFGLGIRRGMTKAGKALNLWSPVYNMVLWGELRGQGKVSM